jgi:hypothetical protein
MTIVLLVEGDTEQALKEHLYDRTYADSSVSPSRKLPASGKVA